MSENEFIAISIFGLVSGINFGLWQKSVYAGVWMTIITITYCLQGGA